MPDQTSVTVVATSAYKTPEFWINALSILALVMQLTEVRDVIPHGADKFVLAFVAAANLLGSQLRNRPTLLGLWPSQTQAVKVDKIAITETETKDATTKPKDTE